MNDSQKEFNSLSKDEIQELVDRYATIAENKLKLSFDEQRRNAIIADVIKRNEQQWEINPDFFIRGRVLQEYLEFTGFFGRFSLFRKLEFSYHQYREYLAAIRDYNGPDQFSRMEITHGPISPRDFKKYLGDHGPHSFTYAVLQAIREGHDTEKQLIEHFRYFFGPEGFMIFPSLRIKNIKETIKFLKSHELITQKNEHYQLTLRGKKCAVEGHLELKHELYYFSKLLTEKYVVILTLAVLILLTSLKLWFGWKTNSTGLFNDGIENSTDITKIVIIALSIKFAKDRLGSIGIMIMMLYAGVTLFITSLIRLFNTPLFAEGQVNGIGIFIAILSIGLNAGLRRYKFIVGKRSGNLSIMTDAKDSGHNVRIGMGVFIGLIFGIFGLYMIDVLVGLLIAILIIYDGAVTLKELIIKGEDIDVDAIHVSTEGVYADRITRWIITTIESEELSLEELNLAFLKGLEIGYKYFDEFAVIGYHQLKEKGISRRIQHLIKYDIIKEENGKLYLTQNGYIQFYQLQSKDFKKLAKSINEKRRKRMKILKTVMGLLIFVGIIGLLIFIYW